MRAEEHCALLRSSDEPDARATEWEYIQHVRADLDSWNDGRLGLR